ncbi:multiple cyclophane-containing RiPP AmcA [Kitasatospora sp. NPDC086791]|uniref:multiple cyclophane-containing RiPP AmcA n=1 Tax=Kitasatospora sp. NPDC086791 TaxID=3155178 RepID=UPI003449C1A3
MTLLELLEASEASVITDLIAATNAHPAVGKFDNRPTWDNANAAPAFDNRPTWDNWNKQGKK